MKLKQVLFAISLIYSINSSLAQTAFELNSKTICTDSVSIDCPGKSAQEILSAIKSVVASMGDMNLLDDLPKGWCKLSWDSDCLINMQKLVDVTCLPSKYEVMFTITDGHYTMRVVKIKYRDLSFQWEYMKGGGVFDKYSITLENNGALKKYWQNLVNVPNEMNSINNSIQKVLFTR
jgi:hypothetical protein